MPTQVGGEAPPSAGRMTAVRTALGAAWRGATGRGAVMGMVLPPFLASKLIGVVAPMVTVWARSTGIGVPPASGFIAPFSYWDGAAYVSIAAHGYPAGALSTALNSPDYVWARFPGYPLLVHLVAYVVPQTVVAGIVVSAVGELVALVFLARLILLERGDPAAARFACWALAVFPYAFYLTAVYTEGAFLAAAIASLYYMRRGQDGRAAVAAAIAMFIHVTGLALFPALVVDHLVRRRGRPGLGLVAIAASLLSPLLFVAYAWELTGDPLAFWHIAGSASFNRTLTWPWSGAFSTWQAALNGVGGNSFIFGMEMIFGVGGLLALLWMAWWWRRIPPSLTVYAAGIWLMATPIIYWLGIPRFEMTAVPIYLLLADLTRRHPGSRPVIVVISAGWMGFIATLAATGQFVA
ncbi:MAG TPA: hypothetical protein VEK76_05880 [Candidatus Binatia bacterium]|nr:hypothetical protein [Candidatus Binatia bacterium]